MVPLRHWHQLDPYIIFSLSQFWTQKNHPRPIWTCPLKYQRGIRRPLSPARQRPSPLSPRPVTLGTGWRSAASPALKLPVVEPSDTWNNPCSVSLTPIWSWYLQFVLREKKCHIKCGFLTFLWDLIRDYLMTICSSCFIGISTLRDEHWTKGRYCQLHLR